MQFHASVNRGIYAYSSRQIYIYPLFVVLKRSHCLLQRNNKLAVAKIVLNEYSPFMKLFHTRRTFTKIRSSILHLKSTLSIYYLPFSCVF